MGAARVLHLAGVGDSPLADDTSRLQEVERLRATLEALRNPAGAVRIAVQALVSELGQLEQKDGIGEVMRALANATAELTHLLAPLGPTASRSPADVISMYSAPGVEGMLRDLRRSVAEQVRLPATLDLRVEPGLMPDADRDGLAVALTGLVQNAVEAMARRRPKRSPWQVELRATLEADWDLGGRMCVVFEVRDHGDGIPPALARWLDDPNGSGSSSSSEGPGMTLQLARRIAEDALGRLTMSRVAGTTRVRLSVPQRHAWNPSE